MLEKLIFGNFALPGEDVRLAIALIGTAVGTYYDIFNKKNIPNNFLYLFLGIAFAINIVFFDQELMLLGLALAAVIALAGYLLYKNGQIGAADVFVLASIALLLPIPPSFAALPFNFPFVAIVFVFSSALFALYAIIYFGLKIAVKRKAKPDVKYALLFIPYVVFAYLFATSPLFSPIYFTIVSIAFLSSVFVMAYREAINKHLAEKVPTAKLEEEDVLALELMDQKFVKKHRLQKLLTKKEIARIRRIGTKWVLVYTKLPPFLPFVFAGIIFALLMSRQLLLLL